MREKILKKYDFGTVNAVCICADDGKCGNV